jgi:hypothetical protein
MEGIVMNQETFERKPGRPRAIPMGLFPKVRSLYQQGFGYRAIARELREDGLAVDWSTVRRFIKAHKSEALEKS